MRKLRKAKAMSKETARNRVGIKMEVALHSISYVCCASAALLQRTEAGRNFRSLAAVLASCWKMQKTLLEGQLGKAGLLRKELQSFTSHIQDALGKMHSDPSRCDVVDMTEFRGDMERLLNSSGDMAGAGLGMSERVGTKDMEPRMSTHAKLHALSKENLDMQAFLSEVQAIVAKSACGAEETKIRMREAEKAHRAAIEQQEAEVRGLQARLHALMSENEELRMAAASFNTTRETERVAFKKQIKKLQKALRDSESVVHSLEAERRGLKSEVEKLRNEVQNVASIRSQLAAGHAELADALVERPFEGLTVAEMARQSYVAEAAMYALREECAVKQEQAEAKLENALKEAGQARAAVAAMEGEKNALLKQVQRASLEQEVQDLKKALHRASQEAREGADEKEELMEIARRYRAQVAALREELRQEVRMCKQQVAAAHERAEEERMSREGSDVKVEELQEEVDRLREEMAEACRKLEARETEMADLRMRAGADSNLGEQLVELRNLRQELDAKTDWLKLECAAQEKRKSSESGCSAKEADAVSSEHTKGLKEEVLYPQTSLTRELGLQRERCLELGSMLASKEAELARAWSEAQKAANIIAQLKEERHEVGSRLKDSEAQLEELRASYGKLENRMTELLAEQNDKERPCVQTVQEVQVICQGLRWEKGQQSPVSGSRHEEARCLSVGLVGCDVEEPLSGSCCSPSAALAAGNSTPAATSESLTASPDSAKGFTSNGRAIVSLDDPKTLVDDRLEVEITRTQKMQDSLEIRPSLGDSAHEASNNSAGQTDFALSNGSDNQENHTEAVRMALEAAQRHRSEFPSSTVWRHDSRTLASEIEALKCKAGGVRRPGASSPATPAHVSKRGESPYKALLDSIGRNSSATRQKVEVPPFSLGKS